MVSKSYKFSKNIITNFPLITQFFDVPFGVFHREIAGNGQTIDVNESLIGLNWLNYISSSLNGYVRVSVTLFKTTVQLSCRQMQC